MTAVKSVRKIAGKIAGKIGATDAIGGVTVVKSGVNDDTDAMSDAKIGAKIGTTTDAKSEVGSQRSKVERAARTAALFTFRSRALEIFARHQTQRPHTIGLRIAYIAMYASLGRSNPIDLSSRRAHLCSSPCQLTLKQRKVYERLCRQTNWL
jgi:hypothetical protein